MIVFAADPLESLDVANAPVPVASTRICSGCGRELPVTEFRVCKGKRVSGRQRRAECHQCEARQKRQLNQRKRLKAVRHFAVEAAKAESVRHLKVLVRAIITRMGGLEALVGAFCEIIENGRTKRNGMRAAADLNRGLLNIWLLASPPIEKFTTAELVAELNRRGCQKGNW